MNRQERIEQLGEIQQNIEVTERKIIGAKTCTYYNIFGKEVQRAHDIEVQNKCLAYWKRRFNRVSFKLMYNL